MTLALRERARAATGRLFDAGDESLNHAVVATWKTLALRGNARCLVCGGTVVRTESGTGCCTSCKSELE
jgi:hypothetical protein